jgi:hypothetical protein
MKISMAILLSLLLASCAPFGFNPMGYEVLHEDLDVAWPKVAAMKYQDDPDGYWKSPAEFFRDGGGDCEDFATALIYLLGPEASFVGINVNGIRHAIVKYIDFYIEPQGYKYYYSPTELDIIIIYSYAFIMRYSTSWGNKELTIISSRAGIGACVGRPGIGI